MTEGRTANQPERQGLRRQLRQAGWNVGAQEGIAGGVRVELWPVPHTGPTEGIEARWVDGVNRKEALRNALRELGVHPLPEDSEPAHMGSE